MTANFVNSSKDAYNTVPGNHKTRGAQSRLSSGCGIRRGGRTAPHLSNDRQHFGWISASRSTEKVRRRQPVTASRGEELDCEPAYPRQEAALRASPSTSRKRRPTISSSPGCSVDITI